MQQHKQATTDNHSLASARQHTPQHSRLEPRHQQAMADDDPKQYQQSSKRSLREAIGEAVVDAVEWADENRRGLVVGSLLGICSECAWVI